MILVFQGRLDVALCKREKNFKMFHRADVDGIKFHVMFLDLSFVGNLFFPQKQGGIKTLLQGLVSVLGMLGDGEEPAEPADVPVVRGGSGSWIETLVEVSESQGGLVVFICWIVHYYVLKLNNRVLSLQ